MVENYNTNINEIIRSCAKIQAATDIIPNTLSNSISPTLEANPRLVKNPTIFKSSINSTINSSAIIYTTPTAEEFYLCGFTISFMNDATSQATTGNLIVIPDLQQSGFNIGMNNITGVAGSNSMCIDLGGHPWKLKKGSNISAQIVGTSVGTALLDIAIWGYTETTL
jgi:hypothetical protein